MDPPDHTQPVSTSEQSLLQPSPLLVLPSSHFSVPANKPSPHTVTQAVGVVALFWYQPEAQNVQVSLFVVEPPLHTQLVSTVDQSDAHPSLLFVFPSSHFSVPARKPSPH